MDKKKESGGSETALKKLRKLWGKFWHFFWEEDTLLSWGVNIVVAFILIKWVIYPGLGMILQTSHPVVAVISNSMDHEGDFEQWWERHDSWYTNNAITKEEFMDYSFKNGFNRGDIMFLKGAVYEKVKLGDTVVFYSTIRKEPIIHRVVKVKENEGYYSYTTKGDRNERSYSFEQQIHQDKVIGKAVLRVPYLGWIKISFVCTVDAIRGKQNFVTCMVG